MTEIINIVARIKHKVQTEITDTTINDRSMPGDQRREISF